MKDSFISLGIAKNTDMKQNHGLRKGYRVQYQSNSGEVKNGTILKISSYSFTNKGIKSTFTSFIIGENGKVSTLCGEKISCKQGDENSIILGPAVA